ncbi:MAG: SNF2-related protein, partial [Undibacterium sp.]
MELFEHQVTGIKFLKDKKKVILADEMGLGKTRQAIMAARESGGKMLVVCPASLKINWSREIWSVCPAADVAILQTGCDESKHWDRIPEWTIVNYDVLEKKIDVIEWLMAGGMDTLILDEAHYIKGKSIRATVIVGGKVKKSDGKQILFEGIAKKMRRVYSLTGTPILNRPIEMFNLLRAIGHKLGDNRSWFAKRYCGAYLRTIIRRNGPPIRYMDESGATNLQELRRMIDDSFLRRKKKDVLDLPAKIVSVMECELTPEWKKLYDTAFDSYLAFLESNRLPDIGDEE